MQLPASHWKRWLALQIALSAVGLIGPLIIQPQPVAAVGMGAGPFIYYTFTLLAVATLSWGLWRWSDERPVRISSAIMFYVIAVGFLAIAWWKQPAALPWAVAFFGVATMAGAFFLGLGLIRLLFSAAHPIAAIARTLVDEAIRMKIAIVFTAALILLVPVLPLAMSAREALPSRLEFYLVLSLSCTAILLTLLTVFLSCGTICRDLEKSRIFLTMTKPVSRLHYLLGKWLGIMAVNALLLAVAGGGIYTFTRWAVLSYPADHPERLAAQNYVLTARATIYPSFTDDVNEKQLFERRLELLRKSDPERFPPNAELDSHARTYLQNAIIDEWHTLGPSEARGYAFKGLDGADKSGDLQLVLQARASEIPADGQVHMLRRLNKGAWRDLTLPHNIAQTFEFEASFIENGQIRVDLANIDPRQPDVMPSSTIMFTPIQGIQLLYRVGSFEANFFRGLTNLWIRLALFAMLGLMAGTQFSFGVSVLVTLSVVTIASVSSGLAQDIASFVLMPDTTLPLLSWVQVLWARFGQAMSDGQYTEAAKMIVSIAAQTIVTVMPSISEYGFAAQISDGREISWANVAQALLHIGLFWTTLASLGAWLLFRKRELARVIV